jgi:NarL family two-component system response regulator LiaR
VARGKGPPQMSEESSYKEGEPARIVIADDHPLMRDALRNLMEVQSDLEVIGEAQNGREALELCLSLRPEVILLDLRMPEMDGVAATRAIKRELPNTAVLILTAVGDPNHLSEALKAGAAGYVLKESSRQEIADAIRKVLIGESPLNQELGMQLLRRLLDKEEKEKALQTLEEQPRACLLGELTQREVEVLRLMARGRTNQQIARSLLVSLSTVKKHVHNITSKLGASDRVQAVVKAIELDVFDDRDG